MVSVKEKGIPYVHAQSYVRAGDKSDVGVEVQAALRSPLGHGEHFRIASITSAVGTREYTCQLNVPHVAGNWEFLAKSGQEIPLPWLSYQVALKSLQVQYRPSINSKHQIIGEYSLRDETPNPTSPVSNSLLDVVNKFIPSGAIPASAAVLATAASSVKSSLKHIWTPVNDNALNHSTSSKFLQTSVEIAAGLGGSDAVAEFVKTDVVARYEREIGPRVYSMPGLTLSFGCNVGVMYPIGLIAPVLSSKKDSIRPFSSYLCDRYHLGGPLSLRGFAPSGVGPRSSDRKDSLGGDTKASAVAMLSVPVPIPTLATSSMRAFLFANVGSLGNSEYWMDQSGKSTIEKLTPSFGTMRASVGAGLSMHLGNSVRVEGTYSFPVLKAAHDTPAAFQLGVGLSIN